MRKSLNLVTAFINLIFPPKCSICKVSSEELICPKCLESLPLIEGNICRFCGKPTLYTVNQCRDCRGKRFYFVQARAVWRYNGFGKDLIHAFKYENERRLAPILAEMAFAKITREIFVDRITWVPLHSSRKAERGYNQSELLAREIGRLSGFIAVPVLKRKRRTEDQNKLPLDKRKDNVKGAFALMADADADVDNNKILLVDDVYTTGSTVNECSRILKRGGAARVEVLTLARTVLEK